MNLPNTDLFERRRTSSPSIEGGNENRTKRDYNYKTQKTGSSKRVPSYAMMTEGTGQITTDAELLRAQQHEKIIQQNNSGQGKASRTSAKCPPTHDKDTQQNKPMIFNDIRKSNKFPSPAPPQQQQPQPLTPKPPRPTVSFGIPPPPPREAFRPPTPVPFMHRVNSLPYVGVPEDDSTFFTEPQPSENFDIQEPNLEEISYITPSTSRPSTPVSRNQPNPMFFPTLDLPDPSPVEFYSSGSSRQLSPSLRDRSPSLPLYIPRIPWYRKRKYQIFILCFILLVLLYIFVYFNIL